MWSIVAFLIRVNRRPCFPTETAVLNQRRGDWWEGQVMDEGAAHLSIRKGKDIEAAVQKAKSFMNQAIAAGAAYKLGHGHGPVHHFFQWWE